MEKALQKYRKEIGEPLLSGWEHRYVGITLQSRFYVEGNLEVVCITNRLTGKRRIYEYKGKRNYLSKRLSSVGG